MFGKNYNVHAVSLSYALRHTAAIRIDSSKISMQAVTKTISHATRHMRQIAKKPRCSDVPLHIHAMWRVKVHLLRARRGRVYDAAR